MMKMTSKTKDDRYQFQPWYVKLWRLRFYLLIPYDTLIMFICNASFLDKEDRVPLRLSWKIAKGYAQSKMNWVYTWDEIEQRLDTLEEED